MKAVQTALVFVRVAAVPLDKVSAVFTSSLLQHQRQYSAHIVLPFDPWFCPAIRSVSQCLVNTADGSTIVTLLSVPWIHNLGTVQAESKL